MDVRRRRDNVDEVEEVDERARERRGIAGERKSIGWKRCRGGVGWNVGCMVEIIILGRFG